MKQNTMTDAGIQAGAVVIFIDPSGRALKQGVKST
jgi:hypothetical protein